MASEDRSKPEPQPDAPGHQIIHSLNATGFPSTVKGKIQKAILRLVLGSLHPDRIERLRENVSTVEGRSRVDAMVAEEVGRQAIADPEYMERAKARFLGETYRKQANIEAVAVKAQDRIEAAPDAEAAPMDPTAEPSDDWMNAFTRAAEDASSDELRERLATILAEEARKPGSISRSTVRLVAELDKEALEALRSILRNRIGPVIIRESEWDTGEPFLKMVMLENHGLVSGTSGLTNNKILIGETGETTWTGRVYGLVIFGEPGTNKIISVLLLTRAGEEIASLLSQVDEQHAFRIAASLLDKANLSKITLGKVIPMGPPGAFGILHEEVLWQG